MRSRSQVGRSLARQRGAVIVYVAFFLGVLLAAAALAIDIGRLYNAQRELQRAANIAALDAASVSGGCYGNLGGDLLDSPLAVAQAEALESLARNGIPASYLSGSNAVQ
ncbi:MAG TPA: pilus assembly protein TadG-related protein, partial [Nevskiaceae bacterium]|nr:pilus assembly protein TadG-related protein [Nevskiaceae bacterium]